eukprot:2560089-Rhodomonas_salina.1
MPRHLQSERASERERERARDAPTAKVMHASCLLCAAGDGEMCQRRAGVRNLVVGFLRGLDQPLEREPLQPDRQVEVDQERDAGVG